MQIMRIRADNLDFGKLAGFHFFCVIDINHTVDFGGWVTFSPVSGPAPRHGSFLVPQSDDSGLGMTLIEDQLGDPIYDLAS